MEGFTFFYFNGNCILHYSYNIRKVYNGIYIRYYSHNAIIFVVSE